MTDAPDRRLEYLPVRRIPPADANVKAHDLARIRESVLRWGFTQPLLLDERTGKLVAGHGRLAVATDLERTWSDDDPPPRGIVREDYGEWLLPVVRGWSSRDDADAAAYAIADNRLTEVGGWQERPLAEQLRDLARLDEDLPRAAGFDDRELRRLLQVLNTAPPASPSEFPKLEPDEQFDHECPRCQFRWNDKAQG